MSSRGSPLHLSPGSKTDSSPPPPPPAVVGASQVEAKLLSYSSPAPSPLIATSTNLWSVARLTLDRDPSSVSSGFMQRPAIDVDRHLCSPHLLSDHPCKAATLITKSSATSLTCATSHTDYSILPLMPTHPHLQSGSSASLGHNLTTSSSPSSPAPLPPYHQTAATASAVAHIYRHELAREAHLYRA